MKRLSVKLHLITWTTTDDPPAGGSSLEQLVPACRSGDRKAQKRLFDALAPKMMALCLRYIGDRPTAEDVLQDGFITLFSRLDSYSGAGSFEGWARRIFVNTALMHLMGYRELMALIERLPADARTVFNMYVIEGYSHKEIAEALGFNEATSRSKLQRARIRLQEMIKEQEKK